jgi:hypothetical protein
MGSVRLSTRSRRRWAPGLIVALSMGLAACGSTQDGLTPETTSPSPSANNDDNVPESLQFTADLVGGGTFSGASTAGQPVVLWFWAPT